MTRKQAVKRSAILAHRQMVYEASLDRLLAGKDNPEYIHYRWKKLKRVRER